MTTPCPYCLGIGFFGDPRAEYVDYCARCEGSGEAELPEGVLSVESLASASYSQAEREYALLLTYSMSQSGEKPLMAYPDPQDVGAVLDFLEIGWDDDSPEDNLDRGRYAE